MNSLTVIILDDDLFLLKALQRTIHRVYPSAKITAVIELDDFWQALKANKSVDLVISDYLMPTMNGLNVLGRCVIENPYAVRVLLTGDLTLISKSSHSNTVHAYLAKPFNRDDLKYLFDNVAELKTLPFSNDIRRELGAMLSFPVYPVLLKKLNTLIDSGDFDLSTIADLVSQEPVIVAKLLQLANSAYLGFQRKTTSITEAISRLGTSMLLSITASLLVVEKLKPAISPALHEVQLKLATHYACCVKKFAKQLGVNREEQDLLFSVALLSFIGKIILLVQGKQNQDINYLFISAYVMKLWGYNTEMCSLLISSNKLAPSQNKLNSILYIANQKIFEKQTDEALMLYCEHHSVSDDIYKAIELFDWQCSI